MTIGSTIRAERARRDWTRQDLAERIGAAMDTIQRWEHDKTLPSVRFAQRLAAAFQLPIGDLIPAAPPASSQGARQNGTYQPIDSVADTPNTPSSVTDSSSPDPRANAGQSISQQRGGAVVAREAHNLQVAGSIPALVIPSPHGASDPEPDSRAISPLTPCVEPRDDAGASQTQPPANSDAGSNPVPSTSCGGAASRDHP